MIMSLYLSVAAIEIAQPARFGANGKARTSTSFRLAHSSARSVLGSSMLLAVRLFSIHCLSRIADLAYATIS